MLGAIIENFWDVEACFCEELCDGHELFVIVALVCPMDADEAIVHGGFHASDGSAGGTLLDRDDRDRRGGIDVEVLPCGGQDGFGRHGRWSLI